MKQKGKITMNACYTSDCKKRIFKQHGDRIVLGHLVGAVAVICLVLLPQSVRAVSPEELVELIHEGQLHNQTLIHSGQGQTTVRIRLTADGARHDADMMRSFGVKLPASFRGPVYKPRTAMFVAGSVAFDGIKIRWEAEDGAKYAYDGKTAYEYRPGINLPQAYIIDPKKISDRKGRFDPRCWTATFSSKAALGSVLAGTRKVEEYELVVKKVGDGHVTMYQVVLNYKNGFTQIYDVDPRVGWGIVKSILTDDNGQPRQEIHVDFRKTPEGGWMPKRRVVKYYHVFKENESAVVTRIEESILEKFTFGPVANNEFTLEGLGVPVGTLVMDDRYPDIEFRYGVPAVTDEMVKEALQAVLDPCDTLPSKKQQSKQSETKIATSPREPDSTVGKAGDIGTGTILSPLRLIVLVILILVIVLGTLFVFVYRQRREKK